MEKDVLNRQSLFDVAVQRLGSVEAIFDLCEANNKSMTEDLQAGECLTMTEPADKKTADVFEIDGYCPATGITQEEVNELTGDGEGVEFWGIEEDFEAQ